MGFSVFTCISKPFFALEHVARTMPLGVLMNGSRMNVTFNRVMWDFLAARLLQRLHAAVHPTWFLCTDSFMRHYHVQTQAQHVVCKLVQPRQMQPV